MKKLTQFLFHVNVYFDVALNQRNADQGAVFRVWLFSCNDSVSLPVRN